MRLRCPLQVLVLSGALLYMFNTSVKLVLFTLLLLLLLLPPLLLLYRCW
jgi:hypothetical protein